MRAGRMRPAIAVGRAKATAFALLFVVSCSSNSPHPVSNSDAARTISEVSALFASADSGSIVASRAESILVLRCMKRRGFNFTIDPLSPMNINISAGFEDLDPSIAAASGYKSLAPAIDSAAKQRAKASAAKDLELARGGDAMGRALFGDGRSVSYKLPDGSIGGATANGCLAEARTKLWGTDVASWAKLNFVAQNLLPQIAARSAKSKLVTSATKKWVECMAQQGYQFLRPSLAEQSRGTSSEIKIAVADATCRRKSDIAKTYAGEYAVAARTVIEENGQLVAQYQTLVKEIAQRAQNLTR